MENKSQQRRMSDRPLYILMLSLHGFIRGHDMELGRDADTGGQVKYAIELVRALGRHPAVEHIDLLTRLIDDPNVSPDYALPEENLGPHAKLIRLPFGPKRYLRKETLWNYLDQMVDVTLHFLRKQGKLPDLIHSHYADAGYVGLQLSQLLGIPLVHTGHSLGRCKRQRLLDSGRRKKTIDAQFNFSQRINAEEATLEHLSLLITSTRQESEEQYGLYENYHAGHTVVIPPGTDTSRFSPPGRKPIGEPIHFMIDRFLHQPDKPAILTVCRPDLRKNLHTLLAAYGSDPELQQLANLVIVAGNRENIRDMEEEQRKVLTDILLDIDYYDLYGKVALPKQHAAGDVPFIYRLAARRRGIFINPALTEPFGLTLIEAAASGLPIVATHDGGPNDIVKNCRNGLLVDPLDPSAIAAALKQALTDREQWRKWARNGLNGVKRHYSWQGHVNQYVKAIQRMLHRERKSRRRGLALTMPTAQSPLPQIEHVLISDIDNTLVGDREALDELLSWLHRHARHIAFGLATGRTLESTLKVLREWRIPIPNVLITAVGSEIYYGPGPGLYADTGWAKHIRYRWRRDALAEALRGVPGLKLQPRPNQREFKLSYNVNAAQLPPLEELQRHLHQHDLHAQLVYSHEAFLDVLPVRASKGHAIRYLSYKWGLSLNQFLVAGDSGNDTEMLLGDTLGVVVSNHSPELEILRGREKVYFAQRSHARGILDGIFHYNFASVPPDTEEDA